MRKRNEALRALEAQLGEHQPLTDEVRAAAEVRVKEAKIAVDGIEAQKMVLRQSTRLV